MKRSIRFRLNGRPTTLETDGDRTLLWVLRGELEATGTKYGCGVGLCGSCTVVVDGEAVRSCQRSLGDVDGERTRLFAEADAQAEALLQDGRQRLVEEVAELIGWWRNEGRCLDRGAGRTDPVLRRAELTRLPVAASNPVEDDGVHLADQACAERQRRKS